MKYEVLVYSSKESSFKSFFASLTEADKYFKTYRNSRRICMFNLKNGKRVLIKEKKWGFFKMLFQ